MRSLLCAALVLLSLALIACGGGGPTITPPNPAGNYSDASLKGQYAFSMTGVDLSGAFISRVGSFTADGAGHIAAGLEDVLSLSSGQPAAIVAFTGGNYEVLPNGRGILVLQAAGGGGLQLNLVMQSNSAGFLLQTDLNATSSGSFNLQNSSIFSATALSGHYAFDFSGVSFAATSVAPVSMIGQLMADGNGNITGGVMDTNDGNVAAPSGATAIPPGTYQLDTNGNGTNYGRGTLAFNGNSFAFYIVDATHIKVLEEDNFGGASGDAVLQVAPLPAQNSDFTGSFVYLVGGSSVIGSQGPVARAARFTADGIGGLGAISLDDNSSGQYRHVSQGSNISNATYSIDPSFPGSGRGTFTFTDSGGGTYSDVFYLISASQGFAQETSNGIIGDGPMYAQTGSPFSLSSSAGNYVFNWSGVQLGSSTAVPFEEDFVGQYALSNTPSSNILGVTDYVELGLTSNSLFMNVGLGGTLSVASDSTSNNLYKFILGGSPSATVHFQAYFANPSTVLLVCSDSDRTTAGVVKLQAQ